MDTNLSEQNLDNELLKEYNSKFYGYGKWKSDFWFIGIEEHIGEDDYENKLQGRLLSWCELEKGDIIDIAKHHSNIKIEDLFNPPIALQSTWRKLILTLLSYNGKDNITKENIKSFQENHWGRLNSENLLIELFPRPCRSTKTPLMGISPKFNFLTDRETYYGKSFIEDRIKHIREKIILNEPEVILFYSNSLINYWCQIIGGTHIKSTDIKIKNKLPVKINYAISETTCYVICPQPAWRNVNANEFWILLGKKIRELRSSHIANDEIKKNP